MLFYYFSFCFFFFNQKTAYEMRISDWSSDVCSSDLGDATTNFQDLSFNIFLPTKNSGSFSIFGFGGLSSQKFEPLKDSLEWEDEGEQIGRASCRDRV